MKSMDLVILGGGPAGLAAAIAARRAGVEDLVILERDREPGGILNQCIHNGFGLHTFQEELTGPEYAARFVQQAADLGIPCKLNTMVLDLSADRVVTAVNPVDGLFQLKAKAVVLAMGCRERPRGALNIPGTRPAGIYTAGTAQRLVNIEGRLPGRRVVILGSGDIGLIMARPDDAGGGEGALRGGADALLRRAQAQHRAVPGRFRHSAETQPHGGGHSGPGAGHRRDHCPGGERPPGARHRGAF